MEHSTYLLVFRKKHILLVFRKLQLKKKYWFSFFLFYCGKKLRSTLLEEVAQRNLKRTTGEIVSFKTI